MPDFLGLLGQPLFHGQETMAEQLVLPRSGDRGDMVGHVAGVPKVYVAGVFTVRP